VRKAILALFLTLIIENSYAQIETHQNQSGQLSIQTKVTGPLSATVKLSSCKFSISLSPNQHLLYDGLSIIFYQSTIDLPHEEKPYLSQAQTYSGYDWNFLKKGNKETKWLGLMCEGKTNFPLETFSPNPQPDETIAIQSVRELNGLKCPALFRNKKWKPSPKLKTENSNYFNISNKTWSGFITWRSKENSDSKIESLRFCLFHGENVIIGASENTPEPLQIPHDFIKTVKELLETIEFID